MIDQGLLGILACPGCGGDLEMEEASLRCRKCGERYPVRNGIPRFVRASDAALGPAERATRESFGFEFTELDRHVHTSRKTREDVITFFRATGLDPRVYARVRNSAKRADLTPEEIGYEPDGSRLRGALVLDAGCGAGRFTRLMAVYGASAIGLDLSEAVDRAAEVCAGHDARFAQGDVLHPPFRESVFDHVFSIGVLHHTRDTRLALRAIGRLVRPGGTLTVWVYPESYWAGPVRKTVTRGVRFLLLRLPVRLRAAVMRSLFMPIGRLQMRLARRRWMKLLTAPLFVLNVPRHQDRDVMLETIFDYWSSPVIRTHTSEEVYDWMAEDGFVDIRILPMPTAVCGTRPAAQG